MKAIILAAGEGNRLKKYTENLPKGMLLFGGQTLIERQIETYQRCGINDISIVKGYASEKIKYKNVKYYTNIDYQNTNMVESFLSAKNEFTEDCIVSYSDILFEDRLLEGMIDAEDDFAVAVDEEWRQYWLKRYGKEDFDTESMSIDIFGNIKELGKEHPSLELIDARYIGLLKFSKDGLAFITRLMEIAHRDYEERPWQQSGRIAKKAYMTDLLNALIECGKKVKAIKFKRGWIEFDTNEDYEKAIEWLDRGELAKQIKL